MTVPTGPIDPPPLVRALSADAIPVWVNGLGGVTWRLPESYLKVGPGDHAAEAERLAWLGSLDLPFQVPGVLGVGPDHLRTTLIDAAPPLHPADPGAAAHALGRSLRMFHDAVPLGTPATRTGSSGRISGSSAPSTWATSVSTIAGPTSPPQSSPWPGTGWRGSRRSSCGGMGSTWMRRSSTDI